MIDDHIRTDDIVERLRNGGARCGWGGDFAWCPSDECDECDLARAAADEIVALRACLKQSKNIEALRISMVKTKAADTMAEMMAEIDRLREEIAKMQHRIMRLEGLP